MDLVTTERAAETLLAPPNLVSADERKQAELYFEELRRGISIDECNLIIQQSKNPFVLFQIGQTIGDIIIRDWSLFSSSDVQTAYKSLLEFVATQPGLEPYVVGAFLKSAAMIVKRGILDTDDNEKEELFEFVHRMLTNESPSLQAAGCLFISALIEQFSSSWRNSKYSITWDFHLKAKNQFENYGLRRLLEMSLTTLHALSNYDDITGNDFTRRLCERFLEVAENIFSWNFSSRLIRTLLRGNQSSNSFRPPATWKDLLENDEFYILFFKLHSKIRNDEQLCTKSLNCIIQLASLTGDCIPVNEQQKSIQYVRLFISNFLELFANGPLPHEVNHFCTIINRLFLYRPLISLMKQEEELRSRFFGFLAEYTKHLTVQAMHKAIGEAEHDDHTSLVLIYDVYAVMLRGRWRTNFENHEEADRLEDQYIKWPTNAIINQFIQCVLAPPQGTRPAVQDECDESDDADDRLLFNDLLTPLGSMICYNINNFMNNMAINMRAALGRVEQIIVSNDQQAMTNWVEDQHWLMLILANSVVAEDMEGECHIESEVYDNTYHLYQEGRRFCPQKKMEYLATCIESPTSDTSKMEVDPFVRLTGELFAWAAIEQEIVANHFHMVSPELCRSTLFALKRFVNAGSNIAEYEKWNSYQGLKSEDLPLIPANEEFSKLLVRFVVKKVLMILVHQGSEEKLCQDAVDCLAGLIESRAPLIASSPELFEYLTTLDIGKLPNRTNFMKVLVQIGAAANDQQLQENMFKLILVPLAEKFGHLCQQPSRTDVDSQLADLLQCFDGVAKASQSQSAGVLFKYLLNVITQCSGLMKTRVHNETVVTTILQLLLDVTTKVTFYLDNEFEEESMVFYSTFLQMIDCYRTDHMKRFTGMTTDDDDKASDLALFIDILLNVLSKDFLNLGESCVATGAKVVIESLQMLLSIMNEKVLQMPEVSLKFYRLILYLVEFSPESMSDMSDDLTSSLCECLKLGMSGQYGLEILSTALESITQVVVHFSLENNKPKCSARLAHQFKNMMPVVFETCLSNSCETSIFAEACSAIYSLIAFERAFFDEYVNDLLSKKSNEAARHILQKAFEELIEQPPIAGNRRGRITFRGKMEQFLNKIQGLLSYV